MAIRRRIRRAVDKWVDTRLGKDYQERANALAKTKKKQDYDIFGFNESSLRYGALAARFLHRKYFRTEVHGIDNVPKDGPLIVVSNHSGQLPFDGAIIGASLLFDASPPRLSRAMVEHFVSKVPYASYIFHRWGQIVGTPENCRRLLDDGETILVFPEGVAGMSKPFSERYQLRKFGSGFMRLALEAGVPILPVAVIGAEEQAPAYNVKTLAKILGTPAFPVVPYPPFFPLLPLPVKYHLHFGQPLTFEGDPEDDDHIIDGHTKVVRDCIDDLLKTGLSERKGIFW